MEFFELHHTKDKGDKGVGFVIADLLSKGAQVALPISEHLPFDIIDITDNGRTLSRVSVKYRAASKGTLRVSLRSSWADRHGTHVRKHERDAYDWVAVYCPTTEKCYYIPLAEVKNESFTLRIVQAKNGQSKNVISAETYAGLPN